MSEPTTTNARQGESCKDFNTNTPNHTNMDNVRKIVGDVMDGHVPALDAYVQLKRMLNEITVAMDTIKEEAIQDFYSKWGGKDTEIAGFVVKKHPGRAVYDYSTSSEWEAKKLALEELQKRMQISGKRVLEGKDPLMDQETGEVYEPARISKTNDTISIVPAK